jgi:hypothetical protein
MAITQDRLDRWQSIASITAAIAIPLILAIFGFLVQNQISSDSLKKDYVEMAINILEENPSMQEKELRIWAATIIEKYSPIPFNQKVKSSLEQGLIKLFFPDAPKSCMVPANEIDIQHFLFSKTKTGYLSIENPDEFSKTLVKMGYDAEVNTASLKCLQGWVNSTKRITDELNTKENNVSTPSP